MKMAAKDMKMFVARVLVALVLLTAPTMTLWGQERSTKLALTTQLFLDELKQPAAATRHSPTRRLADGTRLQKPRRLIARPDTVNGVAYIPCFIHLKDAGDLSAVRALGVEVEETFDGLDFITARVPVHQIEPMAAIDNVTRIKVAQLMRPLTDKARQLTRADDLLTLSADAQALGVTGKYDGTGVLLGIIDTGIDFQHIAFKDKDGKSRIAQAYVYDGSGMGAEYGQYQVPSLTTDDETNDHGTHTATSAGGSSVIVSGTTVTVTDDHANATYGGMAPGADLYLAGIYGLTETFVTNALKKMVAYADNFEMPLVVSNSWGSVWGSRNGTGEIASLVGKYFGDSHPNHIILFASSNEAGHSTGDESGGCFVKNDTATSTSPLATILRTDKHGGDYYEGLIACAWAARMLNGKLFVLDNTTGEVIQSWTVTEGKTESFAGLDNYYDGSLTIYIEQNNGRCRLAAFSNDGIASIHPGQYTLAIEVYPESGSAKVKMWGGDYGYFTSHLTTEGHTWTEGTDDMSVSDEATIPDAISVGAYVSKNRVKNYEGNTYLYSSGTLGDIATFSSYATAEQSPTGLSYPWITAPGAQVVAGVNHYHTASVDEESFFHSKNSPLLVVNDSSNPYGAMQGTSMATPVAAGIVAQWLQAAKEMNRSLTVNDVKDIMEQTAITDDYVTTGANASHFGHGKIDALAGIQYILSNSTPPSITESAKTLLYEGLTKYTSDNTSTSALKISSDYLNYDNWADLTKVYPGGTSNAHSNGGCLKMGTENDYGSMTTGSIALTGNAMLTFYLKQYGTDNGKLNVTVTDALADVTEFTPQSEWTLCTVNITHATGAVTITLETSAKRAYVDEITLTANGKLRLTDNGKNANVIASAAAKGGKYDVTLSGRTLYRDGEWNTICLPFDVDLTDKEGPLYGAVAKTLSAATMEGTHVTLTFGEAVTTLQAGIPYIIKWNTTEGAELTEGAEVITDPVFPNVRVVSGSAADRTISLADGHVNFIGYYNAMPITAANTDIYYLTAGNTLMHTWNPRTLNACRAYFQFSENIVNNGSRFILDFGDGDASVIYTTDYTDETDKADGWYSVDGQKLYNAPTRKGLYIRNGKKVVVQ